MKKTFAILFIILLFVFIFSSVSAEDLINNTVYGETYLCNDAYTVRIVNQPQMVYQIIEKMNIDVGYRQVGALSEDGTYYLYKEYHQAAIQYGRHRQYDDLLLNIRVEFRNLSDGVYHGLSPESFKLVGKVRDRTVAYTPEVMIPFHMDTEFEAPLVRAGIPVKSPMETKIRPVTETDVFNLDRYWNTLLMMEKDVESMRVQDIRLMFRVPNWLFGWELHVDPQPVTADPSLKSCEMALALPVIKNEITGEIYKYVF